MTEGPLIVQSDRTLLLDTHAPQAEICRADLIRYAMLEKSPEHIHTYRLDQLSIWNAISSGMSGDEVIASLSRWSRFPLPESVAFFVSDTAGRWGQVVLEEGNEPGAIRLLFKNKLIRETALRSRETGRLLSPTDDESVFVLDGRQRGPVKSLLVRLGWPVEDRIPLSKGVPLSFHLRQREGFHVRDYQKEAADALLGDGRPGTGYGVVVLPCGSGKTVVGMEVMARLETSTLILTTNIAAVHQWMAELKDKSDLDPALVGEYTGEKKEIKPVTVTTYQLLSWRADKSAPMEHLQRLSKENWGLVIFDEVHMLPAPVFQLTSALQASHRLGLTATLVREDGREEDVFSLVGPKRYDTPWDTLAERGFIAQAFCHEIRVDLPSDLEVPYALAAKREQYAIASKNPRKIEVARELIKAHEGDQILVIGQYLDQLEDIARQTGYPLITGRMANRKREELYEAFRSGALKVLIVSKVANFAIDLPDASVAIQVSGTFGSRSEEAQRLGRILRPKDKASQFYTLVSRFTCEEEFSRNRQKFLSGQGYRYDIHVWGKT